MPKLLTVLVCSPDDQPFDWFTASQILEDLDLPSGTPHAMFPVRRRFLLGWFTRWSARDLIAATRRFGAVVRAAGGRRSRLDAAAAVTAANTAAVQRWLTWQWVVRGTPAARSWKQFLDQPPAQPGRRGKPSLPVDPEQLRRRFEAQPRVLAMMAYNTHPRTTVILDPDELDAFQAGQATYAALFWRRAAIGDMVVTSDGRLLKPRSLALADRLRYLAEAGDYLGSLPRHHQLLAVQLD